MESQRKGFKMNRNHFQSLALLLVFGATPAFAQEAPGSYEMSPEEVVSELEAMDAEEAASTSDLLFDMTREVENEGDLPEVLVEVYKRKSSVRQSDIQEEFALVWVDGSLENVFAASTGGSGNTPAGTHHPQRMHKKWTSTIYNSYMDWAIFFSGAIAIHSTTSDHYHELGRRASKGCVRLARPNARWLFGVAQQAGCTHERAKRRKCSNFTVKVYNPGQTLHPNMVREVRNRLDDDFDAIKKLIRDWQRGRPYDRCTESDSAFDSHRSSYCRR